MIIVGVMNVLWVALLTAVVAIEKLAPTHTGLGGRSAQHSPRGA
jgi:predicted metal-binding membrane protein